MTTSVCGKGETISARSSPRTQTGMSNGSTRTLREAERGQPAHRPVARPRLGLGAGQALADLGGQAFDDVPGDRVVGERGVAQRGGIGRAAGWAKAGGRAKGERASRSSFFMGRGA